MKIILVALLMHVFIVSQCQSDSKPAKIVEVTINGADSAKSLPNTNGKSQPNNKNIRSENLPEIIVNETENKIKINLGKINDTDKIGQAVQEIVLKHTGNQSLARKIADVVSHVSTLPDEQNKKDTDRPVQKNYEAQVTRMMDESIDDPKYSYNKLTDGQEFSINRYSYSPIASNGPQFGISQPSEDGQDQGQFQNGDQVDLVSDTESLQFDNQQETGEQRESDDQNEEQGNGQSSQSEGEQEVNNQNQQESGEQNPQQIADSEENQDNLDIGDSGQEPNGQQQQQGNRHYHNRSSYMNRRIKQRYDRNKPYINSNKKAIILKLLKQYLEDRKKQKSN